MARIVRVCEQCGKVIPKGSGRQNAYFCSNKCRGLSKRKRSEVVCAWCGKEFEVQDSRLKTGRRYCSQDCFRAYSKGRTRIRKTCLQCGKEFECYITSESIHCSKTCYLEALSKARVKKVCPQCENEFETTPGTNAKYCSMECFSLAWGGIGNPNWQGGISFEPYTIEFNGVLKRAIRKRDNHTCAICGKRGRCVHHINYDKADNRPENLITLDRSCHSKTNTDREYWEDLLSPIAIARTNRKGRKPTNNRRW